MPVKRKTGKRWKSRTAVWYKDKNGPKIIVLGLAGATIEYNTVLGYPKQRKKK